MSRVLPVPGEGFAAGVEVLVIGAGACGLTAALAARDAGGEVLVVERDPLPAGSTALSSGFVPAAGTRWQRAKGIDDGPDIFAADIQGKARGHADADQVRSVATCAGPTLEWLADTHGLEWVLLEGFVYPGHSRLRMHAVPERTGGGLIGRLHAAGERAGIDILCNAHASALYADDAGRVHGVRLVRPDGSVDNIGCRALVLACNGYGGNRDLVRRYLPEIADSVYFGHAGNQGDAVLWGTALGAPAMDMGAYQGHGSVAHPHGVLITWALMMEGGIQVNARGERFSNEHQGYSEQAVAVLAQPHGVAWNIYDERLHRLGLEFEDYRRAGDMGAVHCFASLGLLAAATGLPVDALAATFAEIDACRRGQRQDRFGRDFAARPALTPPFYAVKVTGALFHTQGGLVVDTRARVRRGDGALLPNLFAGGGAARGVSGPAVWGYLSGNGLVSAVTLGRIAGENAARLVKSE